MRCKEHPGLTGVFERRWNCTDLERGRALGKVDITGANLERRFLMGIDLSASQ